MRALLILLLVPSFALGLAVGATRVVGQPTPPVAQATGFVWADRVFVSGHDLDAWLKSRGSSYAQWAERHPSLAETFPLSSKRALAIKAEQPSGGGSSEEEGWWNALLAALAAGSAVILVLYLIDQRRPGVWRELAHETGSLGRVRLDRGSESVRAATKIRPALGESRDALRRGWVAIGPRLAHVGPDAVRHGRFAATRTRPLWRRIRRRHLSELVVYAAAVLLAFAIGAAISRYLN